jgi:hypothetical protein
MFPEEKIPGPVPTLTLSAPPLGGITGGLNSGSCAC